VTRYGPMYGPDYTFRGVPACDWREPSSYAGADVVVVGAPFDGGTSHRPGARFGPQVIRGTDYLPHDGSRPHLTMRVDALADLVVRDGSLFEIALDDCDGVFLSVDIDVCDPAHAPGTGTPEPGGLTARQLLDSVSRIGHELPVVGMDIVEVSPPFDHAEITAMLGNRVVLEALSGMARRRADGDGPRWKRSTPLLEGRGGPA
jgi:arginase family enzyme